MAGIDDDGVITCSYVRNKNKTVFGEKLKVMKMKANSPLGNKLIKFINGLPHSDYIVCAHNGRRATAESCYSLLQEGMGLDLLYVRYAASIYTDIWGGGENNGLIYQMVDPGFTKTVLQQEDVASILTTPNAIIEACQSIPHLSRPGASLHLVFLPVNCGDHWWCLVVNVIEEELVVIDSAFRNSFALHDNEIKKLRAGTQIMLDRWGTELTTPLSEWSIEQVPMTDVSEVTSSGIHMLLAIKACVPHMCRFFNLNDEKTGRMWLLCDDVIGEQNDNWDAVKMLLEASNL